MQLDSIRSIAREAGTAIMRVYASDFRVRRKADSSPLTEADSVAHRIIADALKAEHPGIPILSEESSELAPYSERRRWTRYWLVDPLDGTKEFIKRNGQFTVNIALVVHGCPVAGVVYAPARDWMYWGSLSAGAFKSANGGEPVAVRCAEVPESGSLRVVGSNSHLSTETREYLEALRIRYSKISFVAMGSSLKICLVADGSAELYPRLAPTMEWDTAAAHAVLAAAGGRLIDQGTGNELCYNKENLLNGWFVAEGKRLSGSPSGPELDPASAA